MSAFIRKNMKRDMNILKAFKKEIDLKTKTISSKKRYTRKVKHRQREV